MEASFRHKIKKILSHNSDFSQLKDIVLEIWKLKKNFISHITEKKKKKHLEF